MSLLPDKNAGKTFPRRTRGYDPGQVSAFLQRAAVDYAAAIHRISAVAEDQSWSRRAREELSAALADASCQARQAAEQARREADDDARAIRSRAEQAAAVITRNAEETAAALTGQAERLRDAARQDADAAQAVLASARQRAAELEDQTRQRCEALRAETDRHHQRLRAVEHTAAERLRVIDHATAALRSKIGVLDQVSQLEELIDSVRAEVRPGWSHLDGTLSTLAADGAGT
ncbi:MAG: DivIVA domain-containing protein [Actinomycetota bacterium]|nr:DivIVA domain-containing protein [Actinomycetota bacterium]